MCSWVGERIHDQGHYICLESAERCGVVVESAVRGRQTGSTT